MRISIVTPNLNHAKFLGDTLDSVYAAAAKDLDYRVVDGGSIDGSVAVVEDHPVAVSFLVSEPDQGPYDAINKGFADSDGEIMGWINAGDRLLPRSLAIVEEIFSAFPQIEWLTSLVVSFLDERGRLVEQLFHEGVTAQGYHAGEHLPGFSSALTLSFVQQESTFWRRSLWERAGAGLDTKLRYAADYELWARFFDHAELWSVAPPLGAFRRHRGQISRTHWAQYQCEAQHVHEARGRRPRNALAQSVSVGLRRFLPRPLRPIAHRFKLCARAPVCRFDGEREAWALGYH